MADLTLLIMSMIFPSLRMASMAGSYCRNHVVALAGSVSMVLSVRGWMVFMALSRKLWCAEGSPTAVSRIVQATSTEVIPSGGIRFAASPMRAFLSFLSWSDFDTLLSVTAVSKSSLNTMKSSLDW